MFVKQIGFQENRFDVLGLFYLDLGTVIQVTNYLPRISEVFVSYVVCESTKCMHYDFVFV